MDGGQIKGGSWSRSERLAKYNRLLEIECELGPAAIYQSPFESRGLDAVAAATSERRIFSRPGGPEVNVEADIQDGAFDIVWTKYLLQWVTDPIRAVR
ncbi:MAG: hypothetical protein ACREDL_18960, partial [Bradyrhizobium sp.]